MAFTEADRKKLLELQEKQRKAKAEERNQKKRDDRTCDRLFGMNSQGVKDALSERESLKNSVQRFCKTKNIPYDKFNEYIDDMEQRSVQQYHNRPI